MGRRLHQFFSHLESDVSQPLRIRLYRLLCGTTCGLCLLVVLPVNSLQNLPFVLNVAVAVLGLFAGYCYWTSGRGRHYFLAFLAVFVLLLVPVWFLNAGSEGSITFYFLALIIYPVAILRGRTRWVLSTLLVFTVAALYLVEYFYPGLTVPFQSPSDRLLDLEAGVFCSSLAIGLTLWLILKTYDREQLRLSQYARELATSEQNYREIFNSTSEAILIRDHNGRLIDVNERMLAMFGYDRAAITSLSIGDVSSGTDPYTQEEGMRKVVRTIQEGPQTFLWRSRRGNGELFWSEIALRSCEIAGQKRLISAVRDISARMQAEQALRTNEERLRLALAASHQGWFEMNVQTGVGFSSEEYIRIIGFETAEFTTTLQGWLEGIHPEDREMASREYQACVAAGDSRAMEYRRQTKSGEWKWIRSVGKIVEFDAGGKPLRMAGTHTDITERKELEARLLHSQRMESVGTLAAGVAHDLNNILTPMLMATGILEGKLVEKEDRELLTLLEGGAKRGAAIVRQLLTFSREFAQSRVPVNLPQLIRELQGSMRVTFPANIKVLTPLSADLWWVTADPIQLQQVLMNLCLNARDAMPAGGTLTLRAENIQLPGGGSKHDPWGKGGRYVKITVTDTGIGIPPENLGRIFDPFFTTKEAGKGAGLGLSTVYGIVKGHGGSVTVDSQPNHGASFKLVLPASTESGPEGSNPSVPRTNDAVAAG